MTKVNNRFRYRLSLSAPNRQDIRALLAHMVRCAQSDKQNKGVAVYADPDPWD